MWMSWWGSKPFDWKLQKFQVSCSEIGEQKTFWVCEEWWYLPYSHPYFQQWPIAYKMLTRHR
jgi:hypothetical protein